MARRRARIPPHAAPLLREVKAVVHRFLPDAMLLLYGSQARGTAGPESDWDLLILSEEPIPSAVEQQLSDAIYDIELDRNLVISTVFYSRAEWEAPVVRGSPFYENVEREGILI